jgi:hypothetical protein
MSPERGDRAAPPARQEDYEVRFQSSDAAKGWEELCGQAPENMWKAWVVMREHPLETRNPDRHHRLKGSLGTVCFRGVRVARWQIEVTAGGRVWYLVDEERRTVWIERASPRHPKLTE